MKLNLLIASSLGLSCLTLSSATVGVDSGGGDETLIFETAGGGPLVGGILSIGAFDGTPRMGLGFFDIEANFTAFGSQSSPSGAFGNFNQETFEDNVVPSGGSFDFRGQRIYALVTNADQTEFAFFTNDDLDDWLFPTVDDGGIDPSANDSTAISLSEQNNIFVGNPTRLDPDGPDGPFSDFDAIQLQAIPEPSSALLLGLSSLALLRRRSRK